MREKNIKIIGVVSAFLYATSSALSGVLTKLIYKEGIGKYTVFFLCSMISVFVFGLVIFIKNRNIKSFKLTREQFLYTVFIGAGISIFLVKISLFISLEYVEVNIQRPITTSYSLISILLSMFITKKLPNKYKLLSCLLIICGLSLIISNANFAMQKNLFLGCLFAFFCCCCIAISAVIRQFIKVKIDNNLYCFYSFLFTSMIVYFIMNSLEQGNINLLNTKSFYLILITGIFCFAGWIFTFNTAVVNIGATNTTLVCSVGPIITIFLTKYMLGEKMNALQMSGIVLIVCSTIVATLGVKKE